MGSIPSKSGLSGNQNAFRLPFSIPQSTQSEKKAVVSNGGESAGGIMLE
jgi:hypothetical protein